MTEHIVERILAQARERGDFDDLPGTGRPLDLSDIDDPDWWVKRYARREKLDLAGAMPTVLALRKEHEGFPGSLLDLTEAGARAVLQDYNRRVKEDRLAVVRGRGVPVVAPLVDVEAMLGRWRATRPMPPAAPPSRATEPAPPTTTPRGRWWRRPLRGFWGSDRRLGQ